MAIFLSLKRPLQLSQELSAHELFYETNFEIKQTLLLIYYSDYWNLKFVIDSFFVSFKNFLFPSVQQGMIVISVENVKVNECFTIIH